MNKKNVIKGLFAMLIIISMISLTLAVEVNSNENNSTVYGNTVTTEETTQATDDNTGAGVSTQTNPPTVEETTTIVNNETIEIETTQEELRNKTQTNRIRIDSEAAIQARTAKVEAVQTKELIRLRTEDGGFKTNISGLENAIIRVRNNETAMHLAQVMIKIQEKRIQQISKLEAIEIEQDAKTNATVIKGIGKARLFGFIPVNKEYKYEINETGEVVKQKKALDFLFKKQDPIDAEN